MPLPISSLTPFTLQDYPDHTSCIVWFYGCNFRCSYCHNPELITGGKKSITRESVFEFLESRKGLLEGVVCSGGECTLSPDLEDFVKEVKELGYKVKIDTNGSNPSAIKNLVQKKLVDFIALDYKAPSSKFSDIVSYDDFTSFDDTLTFLCKSTIPFEVRTTVHTDLLKENDLKEIIKDLEYKGFHGNYCIQNFINEKTLTPLPKQKRILDISRLPAPKNFTIIPRNF